MPLTIQTMLGRTKQLADDDAAQGFTRPGDGVLWTIARRCGRKSGFHYLDEKAILAAYRKRNADGLRAPGTAEEGTHGQLVIVPPRERLTRETQLSLES